MKIAIHSDFHIEFGSRPHLGYSDETLRSLQDSYFFIAGDLSPNVDQLVEYLDICSELTSKGVYFVPGNHEYYRNDIFGFDEELKAKCTNPNVTILQNEVVEIEDHILFGSTFWTNMNDSGRSAEICDMSLNDFRLIRKEGRRYRAYDSMQLNKIARASLIKTLVETEKKVIVMTHHAPSSDFSTPEFNGSAINPAFNNSGVFDLLGNHEVKLWVHGHRHSQSDGQLGKTRIICNPYGYPNEPAYIADFTDKTQPYFVEV